MHVTDWAAALKEDPKLDTVLQWLESRKKTDLRTLLGECVSNEEGRTIWRNHQIPLPSEVPFTYAPAQKGRMRICYSLWCPRHIRLLPQMGAIGMQDIKAMTTPSPYYKNAFGGQVGPSR